MAKQEEHNGILRNLDWWTIVIYIALLGLGWMSVCGATYEFGQDVSLVSFSSRSGMQIIWIGTSLLLGALLLSIDERVYESFSYLIYGAFLLLLLATPFLARNVKGSMSWIDLGPLRVQPAEFAKFGTALCVARAMSMFELHLNRIRDLFIAAAIVVVPMVLIVMQKETGSALVYLSFFLMFYREGMSGSFLFVGVAAIFYFVVGIRFANAPLLDLPEVSMGKWVVFTAIWLFTTCMTYVYTRHRAPFWWMLGLGVFFTVSALLFAEYVLPFDVCWVQAAICAVCIISLLYLSLRERLTTYFYIAIFALGSIGFHYSVNYVVNDIMGDHQSKRIYVLLGIVDDPRGAGYNVNQACIAIGSGGLQGKGFLNGTQTKLKYVPEQETDFIFCTVGEEEGFVGCTTVLLLFLALILRLIHVAERQVYRFGRIYGYCVLSVFFFHVLVNVGMVLGMAPVIGIPLPFFSYGGSSLWGFTILLFILLRIDASRKRMKRRT
ncbi:MAG: rod shape-determining protein RodA [Bacteroidales bacterium]|nr:rod shape-determining protein RodA [Candidatus Physcousia equi]